MNRRNFLKALSKSLLALPFVAALPFAPKEEAGYTFRGQFGYDSDGQWHSVITHFNGGAGQVTYVDGHRVEGYTEVSLDDWTFRFVSHEEISRAYQEARKAFLDLPELKGTWPM